MRIRRGYVSLDWGQLHYAEAGQGPPLLLLHSVPRSSRAFRFMLPQLAPHFRAIAPDLPGFGQSDPMPEAVSMPALANAMAAFLQGLGIDRAHVFGYHTGNKVAAALAADHPARIDRLILCGQIHSIIPDQQRRDEAIRHIVQKYFASYPVSNSGDELLRRWVADWTDVSAFALPRALFSAKTIASTDIEELKVRVVDHVQALSSIAATYDANFRFDFAAALQKIAAPTLVLELAMPDEEHYGHQLDAVCALLANARGATVMNAGKVALESHTRELVQHLCAFVRSRL